MTEAVLPFPFRFPFPFSVSPSPITVYRSSTRPPIGCWRREMEIRIGFLGTNRSNPQAYSGLLKSTRDLFFRPFFRDPKKVAKRRSSGVILAPKTGRKPTQTRKKNTRKSIKMVTSVLSSISGRCRSGKWRPRTPLNPLKLLVFLYQNEKPLWGQNRFLSRCWCSTGSVLNPFSMPKVGKNRENYARFRLQKTIAS